MSFHKSSTDPLAHCTESGLLQYAEACSIAPVVITLLMISIVGMKSAQTSCSAASCPGEAEGLGLRKGVPRGEYHFVHTVSDTTAGSRPKTGKKILRAEQ